MGLNHTFKVLKVCLEKNRQVLPPTFLTLWSNNHKLNYFFWPDWRVCNMNVNSLLLECLLLSCPKFCYFAFFYKINDNLWFFMVIYSSTSDLFSCLGAANGPYPIENIDIFFPILDLKIPKLGITPCFFPFGPDTVPFFKLKKSHCWRASRKWSMLETISYFILQSVCGFAYLYKTRVVNSLDWSKTYSNLPQFVLWT